MKVVFWRGYDSESSLDGVSEQEASRCVDLVVLLLDELGDFLQHLDEGRGGVNSVMQ